jgi:hypothetical protein
MTGASCNSSPGNIGTPNCTWESCGNGGGWGGWGGGSAAPIGMAPYCLPDCVDCSAGSGPGGGGGGGGSGPGGGGSGPSPSF